LQQAPSHGAKGGEAGPRANLANPVVVFLKECGLQMYSAKLLQSGFDEMETLFSVEDADLRDLGLPPYHVTRLRKSLREQQQRERAEADGSMEGERNLVVAFLEEHGLGQYADLLLGSGFDEMETLLDVDDVDLKDLGLPRGHALKLKRHLRQYQINSSFAEESGAVAEVTHVARPMEAGPSAPPSAVARSVPPCAPSRPHHLDATETMKGDVEQSWETIQKLGVAVVGERIYRSFFALVPQAMECFPLHVRNRYREWTADESEEEDDMLNSAALRKLFGKVINAVGCVVAGLQDSSKLVPLLTSLGRRHIGYGLEEHFWPLLGKALNEVLSDMLAEGWTTQVEHAWNVVYGFASSIMIAGLRDAKQAAGVPLDLRTWRHDACVIKASQMSRASSRSTGSHIGRESEDSASERSFEFNSSSEAFVS